MVPWFREGVLCVFESLVSIYVRHPHCDCNRRPLTTCVPAFQTLQTRSHAAISFASPPPLFATHTSPPHLLGSWPPGCLLLHLLPPGASHRQEGPYDPPADEGEYGEGGLTLLAPHNVSQGPWWVSPPVVMKSPLARTQHPEDRFTEVGTAGITIITALHFVCE